MAVPRVARAANAARPTRWVGRGTPRSCTSKAVVAAVRKGGIIRFRCGPRPITIVMRRTAKLVNTHKRVVIDGGGRVTLSGAGQRRILYMDTCDPKQVWTTSHCQNQATPHLVVQHIRFVNGNSTGQDYDGGGGGAIFARGGASRSSTPPSPVTDASGTGPTSAVAPFASCRSSGRGPCTSSGAGSCTTCAATGEL